MGSYRDGYEEGLKGGGFFEETFTEIFVNDKEYKKGYDAGIIEHKRRKREEEREEEHQRREDEREQRRAESERERAEKEKEDEEEEDDDDDSYSPRSYYSTPSPSPSPPPAYVPPVAEPTSSIGEFILLMLFIALVAISALFFLGRNNTSTEGEAPTERETGTGSGSTSGPSTESSQSGSFISSESFSREKEKNNPSEPRNSADKQTSVFVRRPTEKTDDVGNRNNKPTNEQTSVFVRRPTRKTPTPEKKATNNQTRPESASVTLSARNGWVPIRMFKEEGKVLMMTTRPNTATVFVRAPDGRILQTGSDQREIIWSEQRNVNFRGWQTWFASTKSRSPVTLIVTRKTGR